MGKRYKAKERDWLLEGSMAPFAHCGQENTIAPVEEEARRTTSRLGCCLAAV